MSPFGFDEPKGLFIKMKGEKKMSKWLKVFIILLGVLLLLYINPVDRFNEMRSKQDLNQLLSDPNILEDFLDGNTNMKNIRHIGGMTYFFETEKGQYMITLQKEKGRTQYDIFEHKTSIGRMDGY